MTTQLHRARRNPVSLIAGLLIAVATAVPASSAASAPEEPDAPAAMAPTMKAIRYHAFGGVDTLRYEEAPKPVPAAGELLVRVHAAGVNPVDAKVRSGMFGRGRDGALPAIPGYDLSGTVEGVGEGVTRLKAGDEVFAYVSLARGGAYAEYAIVKESEAATKPAKLGHIEAAGVPLAALTAWQALFDTAKLQKGQTVLIHGGSGGVGSFAVQLAKARGAKVIATASERNLAFLRELGADEAIDYNATRFETVVRDVDVVLDTVGGDTQERSFGVLKKGGVLVSIVQPPSADRAKEAGVRAEIILVKPDAAELAEIAALIDAGKVRSIVSETLPLKDAAKAHEMIETRHTRGKIVLKVRE